MDEPFSALDPLIRRKLQTLLLNLQDRLNKTIVFITHDVEEARTLGGTVALLNQGRLIQQGSLEQMTANPADEYVASFLTSSTEAS
jgi:glycine betaine/proline transport system ATP-binding protein